MQVYWPGNTKKELKESLKQKLNGIDLIYHDDNLHRDTCRVLISGVPEEDWIKNLPNLEILIIPWAGLPKATYEIMRNYRHIAVHNIHHNAGPAAETAIALMFASARNLMKIDRNLRNNNWTDRYDDNTTILIEGKTAMILGYGAIGRKINAFCHGLGLKTIPINRTGRSDGDNITFPVSELDVLLPQANIFFVAIPWTCQTDRFLGTEQLSLLPDNAIIINVARGAILDEAALYNELKSGRIRAGIDVWYNYPKEEKDRKSTAPSIYPFGDLDNVVMSPHMGGHSDRTNQLRIDHLARLLNLAALGKDLPNRVDLDIGY